MQQNITYNTNTTQNTTITTYLEFILKTVTIVTKLSVTFLMTLTLTFREDAASLSPLFKAGVSFTINIPIGTTLALTGLLSVVRMFDIHATFVYFKFYPWTFQEVPKTTPASKLATKAATVPETPVRDSKPSPKKTVTPKKDKKDVDKETPIKGTPKVSKSEEVVEVPPSLEKKKSGYHGFMARDGPRTLGSKEIPQVGFEVQDLIVNSPLLLRDVFL